MLDGGRSKEGLGILGSKTTRKQKTKANIRNHGFQGLGTKSCCFPVGLGCSGLVIYTAIHCILLNCGASFL